MPRFVKPKPRFVEGKIYRAKDGAYDKNFPEYDHYEPTVTGDFCVADCWVVDKYGNACPSYSQVPVRFENLREIIVS